MKKVLFIAYYYPPLGGAGVQRITKFVRYLPNYGYTAVLVAGTGNEDNRTPVDDTLVTYVESATTFRVKLTEYEEYLRQFCQSKFIRSLVPGIHFKWWTTAVKRICQNAVQIEKPDIICVTVSPYSAAEAACAVARKYNIPWVLDIRDPWALDTKNYYPTWLHYQRDLRAMKKACQTADAVIMNTPRSLYALKGRFPKLSPKKSFCITNGWDNDDFEKEVDYSKVEYEAEKLTIVHTGQFHTRYAIKVEPSSRKLLSNQGKNIIDFVKYSSSRPHFLAMTPYYFFKALRLLLDERKISEDDIQMICVGNATEYDKNLAKMFNIESMVQFTGYVGHSKSISYLASADVLFLLLFNLKNNGFPLLVSGKTYEYMASRKPILALVPPGDERDFVQKSGLGFVCDPTDVQKIAQTLLDLLHKYRSPMGIDIEPDDQFIQQFERKTLTKKLAKVFNFAISSHRSKYTG